MICFGINPIAELLRSPLVPDQLYVEHGKHENPRVAHLLRQAEQRGIPVQGVHDLTRLCQHDAHQGLAAELPEPVIPLPPPGMLGPRVAIFDGLQDPHNFGAALRVCDVFGFHDVVFHKGNSSGLTPVAIKSSAGAAFHLRICHDNLNHAARRLQGEGYALYALDARGPVSIYDCPVPERLALVIGAEDKGVRHVIQRLADLLVHIPMRGRVDSLNVSCALSAALSELSRRSPPPPAA